jgi:hypothetical protein
MATGTLIPKISINDVPAHEAKAFKAVGLISEYKTREIANGYVQVEVDLKYNREDGSEATFYARWNVRPEWFTPEYAARVKSGEIQGSEKTQYDINMSGLTRGLFAAAGLDEIDFDQLAGKLVGFKTKTRKDDPSRLDISYFYRPKSN